MCSGSESIGAAALAGRLCSGGVGVDIGTEVSAARRIVDVGDEADISDEDGVVGACAAARGDGETAVNAEDGGAAEFRPPLAAARGDAVTKADMGRRKPPGAGDEKGACAVDAD